MVVVLLAAVVLAAATGTPWRWSLPVPDLVPGAPVSMPPAPTPAQELGPREEVAPTDVSPVTWLLTLVGVVVALLLVVVARRVIAALRAAGRDVVPEADTLAPGSGTLGGGSTEVDLSALDDAVAAALARLDDVREPHDAVVAAWVELEHAAERHGWERVAAETATEFTGRLLAVSPAPPADVATLRRLYQQARFTSRPVTAQQVAAARTALERIARAVERPAW
ncbi:hypothetical protein DNL40_14330 [Xylanimonas oleitrophica]|uniref:Protein-glutamine gamma-glutamyltransferase-like C-terminal domain-containing protein n=1 Tax=Xylanimonas oleitrophica TaxID=2607479 RepID=A0A2W5XQY5_9MICO|nr:hypothetical protein DNL40_14330 [Xylanimonas oleitrophica]